MAPVSLGRMDRRRAGVSFSTAAREANKGDRDSIAVAEGPTSAGRALSESAPAAIAHVCASAKYVGAQAKCHCAWRTVRHSEIDIGVSETWIEFDRPARQALRTVGRAFIAEVMAPAQDS